MIFSIRRLRHLGIFSQSGIDKKSQDGEIDVMIVNYKDVFNNRKSTIQKENYQLVTTPASKLPFHLLEKGDVLLTPSSETSDDIGHSAVVIDNFANVSYSYHLIRFRPFSSTKLLPEFSRFGFQANTIRSHLARRAKGTTRQILNRNDFSQIPFLLPDLETQHEIADFLDIETARIDALIEKKEQTIELLRQRYHSTIVFLSSGYPSEQLNTFSSSSVVPLQEKIHSIPKPTTWKIDKLHRILKVRRGKRNSNMQETNLLSLSYGRIKRRDISTTDGLLPDSFEGYQIVEPGNIVLRLTDLQNDKKSLRQGLVTERGIITSAYDALETKKGHEPSFWYFVLFSLDLAKYYYSLGGGVRQSIKFADFPNEWIAFPSLEEQQSISENLKKQENTYISLQEKLTQSIDLLKKYRTTLITAAVTGQIDVGTYKKTGRAESKFDDLQEKIEQ